VLAATITRIVCSPPSSNCIAPPTGDELSTCS
jgi:hypothetical protein